MTFCMVDDSSCVMSAGLSLGAFPPTVWANMFSRPGCGHCLMGSSQHGWYHHQVTLPGLDNTRLFPLWSYGKCPGEPCRMLHINTSWHLLGDKQPWYKYFFFMNPRPQSLLSEGDLWVVASSSTLSGNKCSVLSNLCLIKMHRCMKIMGGLEKMLIQ